MKRPAHPNARCDQHRRRGGLVAALTALPLLVLALTWFGCRSAQQRYEVLSFFFDGVPNPNAPTGADGGEEGAGGSAGAVPVSFMHKPYQDNQCDACHGTTGRFEEFTKADNSVCFKCHQGVQTKYANMHGPVALGECNLCHVPHESSIPALLLDTPRALCTTCHVPELLSPEPADHLTDRNCLDCHVGHGSQGRHLLRIAAAERLPAATPSPATGPAQ
jgi:predicted CXXCH cytochrome family protein